MSNKVTKLVAVELEVTEKTKEALEHLEVGDKFTLMLDRTTGKFYRPNAGWTVEATDDGDLRDMFTEVL